MPELAATGPRPPLRAQACLASLGLVVLAACSVPTQGWTDAADDTGAASTAREAASISGLVSDSTGTPVAGAHVVTSPHGFEATTDADGVYTLDLLPADDYQLTAAADGYAPTTQMDLSLVAGDSATQDLSLEAQPSIDGRVTLTVEDPTGLPLAGALATASSGQTATADADGVITLDGVGGTTIDLVVAVPDDSLWPYAVTDVAVPQTGGVQLSAHLAGRAEAGAAQIGKLYCQGCHSGTTATWSETAHGQALATELSGELADAVAAGLSVDLSDLGGPSATLSLSGKTLSGKTPTVTLLAAGGEARSYDIAGLIGDARSASVPYIEVDGQAWPLPLAWVATDLQRDDWPEGSARVVPWQTERWFDSAGEFTFASSSTPAPTASAEMQCFGCHATGYSLAERSDGSVDMTATFASSGRWNDAAVACEACHGPGETHANASSEDKPYRITVPTLLDRSRSQDVCARCHSAIQSDTMGVSYAYDVDYGAFHPGQDLADFGSRTPDSWANGTAAGPGQQADELATSVHGSAGAVDLLCVDCHDPHGTPTDAAGDPIPAMTHLDWRDNSLCATCHLGLSFDDDQGTLEDHTQHYGYDPDGATEMSRCTGCHMPKTAARVGFGELSGAGDLSSHMFIAPAPQVSLDVFDAESADTLDVGTFPIHACAECHAYRSYREDAESTVFGGPTGDPTLRATQENFQAKYEVKFP